MSCFDAPISRCEVMHTMVVTDQTEDDCVLEHGCPVGRTCPLAGCLAEAQATGRTLHGAPRASVAA